MSKPRGRPPLDKDDPTVPLQVCLPSKDLTAITDKANDERLTVQEWIRRVLRHASGGSNKSV